MLIYDILKRKINSNKILVKNFSSLSILQLSNYVVPLITFPYLTRVLGPEKFGLVYFAYAFVAYFASFVEFGYNVSATQQIAICKDDNEKTSTIFWNVIFSKMVLFVISTLFFIILLYSFNIFSMQKDLFVLAYFSIIGMILFPQWLLMGKENMKIILYINLPIKIIHLCSIFLFVSTESDWKVLILLNSLSIVTIGLIGFIYVIYKYKIEVKSFVFEQVKTTLIDSSQIFVSLFSISLYSTNNIFLLGLFADKKVLGLFIVAEKLRLFMQIIPHNITESFFPRISEIFQKSKEQGLTNIKYYTILILGITFVISLTGFVFSDLIIITFFGVGFKDSILYFKILSWVPLIIAARETFGKQIMLNLGLKKEFMNIYIFASFFSLIMSIIFVPYHYAVGTAVILLSTEVLVFLSMYLVLKNFLKS